jgi:type IV pilus assembly protein PilO
MEGQTIFEKIEAIKMPVRLTILIGSIALIAGAFFYFFYLPKSDEIKKAKASIDELDTQLQKAKAERAKLPATEKKKKEVDAQFNEALKMLPNSKEIPSLLTKVSNLANDAQLDAFGGFTPKPEVEKEFYVEVPISIEVRGTFHNVAIFFDKVGHMERIMNIKNVSMKPVSERSTTLITTCDAITYRFKGNK